MFSVKDNYAVYLIEDDLHIKSALVALFESIKLKVYDFSDPISFLQKYEEGLVEISCIVLDVRLPIMSGLELFKLLRAKKCYKPIIFITAHGEINMAVQAMKEGAFDFIPKPFNNQYLIEAVQKAFIHINAMQHQLAFKNKLLTLTVREKEILTLLLEGKKNKEISYYLKISISSVELSRASLMKKLQLNNIMEILKYNSIIEKEFKELY